MDAWVTVLGTIVVGAVGALSTVVGQRVSARSQERSADIGGRADEWQKLFDEMKEWTQERLEERDRQIEGLRQEVSSMRGKFDTLQEKYRAALRLLSQWMSRHPETVGELVVPEEIRNDMGL
ncbi:hypothetical protein [Corynebacterium resistens]|uniref:hypothetical protein n=1 Tax=Corynebacterium resistens TaxID=258224 RepID=UPI002353CCCD|nr:hypothetical protein [Corynebacterium resistens]